MLENDRNDVGRDVERRRQQIAGEVRRENLSVADNEVLRERVADGLREAAFDLRFDLLVIDRAADVVHADDAQDARHAGRQVDFDLDRLRRVSVAVVRPAGPGFAVERGGRRRAVLHRRFRRITALPRGACRERGVVNGAPAHQRHARRRGRTRIRREGAVVGNHRHRVERQIERLGRDLPQDQMSALSDVGGPDAHHRALDALRRDQLDGRRRLLRETERIADVLDPARNTDSAAQRRSEILRTAAREVCPHLLRAALEHGQRADTVREHVAGRLGVAFAVEVLAPDVGGIDLERVGDARDHRLGGPVRLRRAEPAERPARHVVGVDDDPIGRDVRDPVRPLREDGRAFQDFDAGRSVRAPVGDGARLDRDDRAVALGAPLRRDVERVALVVPDSRFFAVPNDRDRPLRVPRRECEQRLDGEVLPAAERAADLRVANRDRVLFEPQHRRDLAQIFVQPLPRRFDDQRRTVVVCDPGIGLKVRVLLP